MYTHTHMDQLKPDHARSALMGTASALEPQSRQLRLFTGRGAEPSCSVLLPGELWGEAGGQDGGDAGAKVLRSCW